MGWGSQSARLAILVSGPASVSAKAEGRPVGGYDKHLLESALMKCGVDPAKTYITLCPSAEYSEPVIKELNSLDLDMILAMGETALRVTTGKRSIDKWQLSPMDSARDIKCRKVVPTFNFPRLNRQYDHRFFFYKAVQRAVENCTPGYWIRKPANFLTNLNLTEATKFVWDLSKTRDVLSVDIETSHGIINTMGLAWSSTNALAVKCRPDDARTSYEFYDFWRAIRHVLENPDIKKIYQNNIFESAYFNLYGIKVTNTWHDTMFAQKVLYPEFKSGLANVGRLFTMEPYWKDDGTTSDDGNKRDWNNIEDWTQHLVYNCKDTTGTFEAALNQRKELHERGLLSFFDDYIMKLAEPIQEMCRLGLPVDITKVNEAKERVGLEIAQLTTKLSKPFNHKSPKQKLEHFKAKGYKIPTKKNTLGQVRESTDELSLKKLRLKYPHDEDLDILLRLAKLEKFHSSYINFKYDTTTNHVHYGLNGTGTETLRFSSNLDPWNRGFNAQTIPKKAKGFFPPPAGHVWLNVDLEKAESFFVAYRSADATLMKMLNDGDDIHSYVAANIFGVPIEQVLAEKKQGNESKRQLGKKSGHGANYAMAATTFMESCLKELNHVLTKSEATHILETYHSLFPGIRRWHEWVRNCINTKARLDNPFGYHRYFYGRKDDNTYREAYAWEPQSTIPMVTNSLLLGLMGERVRGRLHFNVHLQCHDSLLFSVRPEHLEPLMTYCHNLDLWQRPMHLPGGTLRIPVSTEWGTQLDKLEKWNGEKP